METSRPPAPQQNLSLLELIQTQVVQKPSAVGNSGVRTSWKMRELMSAPPLGECTG